MRVSAQPSCIGDVHRDVLGSLIFGVWVCSVDPLLISMAHVGGGGGSVSSLAFCSCYFSYSASSFTLQYTLELNHDIDCDLANVYHHAVMYDSRWPVIKAMIHPSL